MFFIQEKQHLESTENEGSVFTIAEHFIRLFIFFKKLVFTPNVFAREK